MTGSFRLVISIFNDSSKKGSCGLDCHRRRPCDIWACAVTNDHALVHGSNTDGICVNVCGSSCHLSLYGFIDLGHHLKPCWYPKAMLPLGPYWSEWFVLLPKTMVTSGPTLQLKAMSDFHCSTTTRVCVDVCDPCYLQRLCGCPWPRLSPESCWCLRAVLSWPHPHWPSESWPQCVGEGELALVVWTQESWFCPS